MAKSTVTIPIFDVPTAPVVRRRTWPAILTLFFLSPVVAEMLTGSTPPLSFINPISLLIETTFYGSSAILIREVVRRRGLGWQNILLLGAAYGILEEGLVVTSWFNPYWSDLGKLAAYGRLLDTSWVWATELTIFHAVVSITIPILLTEIIFPGIARRPWLRKRGFRAFSVLLILSSALQMLYFGFLLSRKQGYPHPPLMYFGALAMAVAFLWLGLRYKPAQRGPFHISAQTTLRPAPGTWKVGLLAFAITFAFFFNSWVLPFIIPLAIIPILLALAITWLSIRVVRAWARRPAWSNRQQLALATGAIGFFVFVEAPLAEFGAHISTRNETGLFPVDLLFFAGLGVLAFVVAGRERKAA